jgi:hypothetical protein
LACTHADGFDDSSVAVAVEVGTEATASKAASRNSGSDLPLFSARRRMPAQAVFDKKYLFSTFPVSNMSLKDVRDGL